MDIYSKIYYTLCQKRKQLINEWVSGSNLHRHHIIPKHSGGTDNLDNYTYLTIREHIIAHFLLWKMHKNVNDLRAMKMLGAKLTTQHRKIIGKWCHENKIGFHNATPKERKMWSNKGFETQKNSNSDKSFYYWSTKEGRRKRASMGGKAGGKKQSELGLGFHNPKHRKEYASLGGKSLKGFLCVTNGEHRTRIPPEKLDEYISKGYRLGFTLFS